MTLDWKYKTAPRSHLTLTVIISNNFGYILSLLISSLYL